MADEPVKLVIQLTGQGDLSGPTEALNKLTASFDKLSSSVNSIPKATSELKKLVAAVQGLQGLAKIPETVDKVVGSMGRMVSVVEGLVGALARTRGAGQAAAGGVHAVAGAAEGAKTAFESFIGSAEKLKDILKQVSEMGEGASFSKSLTRTLTGFGPGDFRKDQEFLLQKEREVKSLRASFLKSVATSEMGFVTPTIRTQAVSSIAEEARVQKRLRLEALQGLDKPGIKEDRSVSERMANLKEQLKLQIDLDSSNKRVESTKAKILALDLLILDKATAQTITNKERIGLLQREVNLRIESGKGLDLAIAAQVRMNNLQVGEQGKRGRVMLGGLLEQKTEGLSVDQQTGRMREILKYQLLTRASVDDVLVTKGRILELELRQVGMAKRRATTDRERINLIQKELQLLQDQGVSLDRLVTRQRALNSIQARQQTLSVQTAIGATVNPLERSRLQRGLLDIRSRSAGTEEEIFQIERQRAKLLQEEDAIRSRVAARIGQDPNLRVDKSISKGVSFLSTILALRELGFVAEVVSSRVSGVFEAMKDRVGQALKFIVGETDEFRKSQILLESAIGDTVVATDILNKSFEISRRLPIAFKDALNLFRSIAVIPDFKPLLRDTEKLQENMEGLTKLVTQLATINPAQGTEGALFALKEFVAGQTRSITARFNIPAPVILRGAGLTLQQIKSQPILGLKAIGEFLDIAVGKEGFKRLEQTVSVNMQRVVDVFIKTAQEIGQSGLQDHIIGLFRNVNKEAEAFLKVDLSSFASSMSRAFISIVNSLDSFSRTGIAFLSVILDFEPTGNRFKDLATAVLSLTQKTAGAIGNLAEAIRGPLGMAMAFLFKQLFEIAKFIADSPTLSALVLGGVATVRVGAVAGSGAAAAHRLGLAALGGGAGTAAGTLATAVPAAIPAASGLLVSTGGVVAPAVATTGIGTAAATGAGLSTGAAITAAAAFIVAHPVVIATLVAATLVAVSSEIAAFVEKQMLKEKKEFFPTMRPQQISTQLTEVESRVRALPASSPEISTLQEKLLGLRKIAKEAIDILRGKDPRIQDPGKQFEEYRDRMDEVGKKLKDLGLNAEDAQETLSLLQDTVSKKVPFPLAEGIEQFKGSLKEAKTGVEEIAEAALGSTATARHKIEDFFVQTRRAAEDRRKEIQKQVETEKQKIFSSDLTGPGGGLSDVGRQRVQQIEKTGASLTKFVDEQEKAANKTTRVSDDLVRVLGSNADHGKKTAAIQAFFNLKMQENADELQRILNDFKLVDIAGSSNALVESIAGGILSSLGLPGFGKASGLPSSLGGVVQRQGPLVSVPGGVREEKEANVRFATGREREDIERARTRALESVKPPREVKARTSIQQIQDLEKQFPTLRKLGLSRIGGLEGTNEELLAASSKAFGLRESFLQGIVNAPQEVLGKQAGQVRGIATSELIGVQRRAEEGKLRGLEAKERVTEEPEALLQILQEQLRIKQHLGRSEEEIRQTLGKVQAQELVALGAKQKRTRTVEEGLPLLQQEIQLLILGNRYGANDVKILKESKKIQEDNFIVQSRALALQLKITPNLFDQLGIQKQQVELLKKQARTREELLPLEMRSFRLASQAREEQDKLNKELLKRRDLPLADRRRIASERAGDVNLPNISARGAFRRGLDQARADLQTSTEQMVNLAKGGARNMAQAFENGFFGLFTRDLKNAGDFFGHVLQEMGAFWVRGLAQILAEWVSTLALMLVQWLFFKKEVERNKVKPRDAMDDDITGDLGRDIVGTIINSGITAAITSAIGGAKGGIFPGSFIPIRAFAGGGIVGAPTLGMIAEAGRPEAIVPLPDGRAIPVKQLDQPKSPEMPLELTIVNAFDPGIIDQGIARNRNTILNIVSDGISSNRSLRTVIRQAGSG